MNQVASKWKLVFLLASLALVATAGTPDPAADPKAVVVVGNTARFTVLTDRLIRMEYSPVGVFEDRASLAFVNRRLPVPAFKSSSAGEGCVIETESLRLVYAGGAFGPDSLSVRDLRGGFVWRWGDSDAANLYGTCRTLDTVDSWDAGLAILEKGLVSRDGWALVDDSSRPVFVPSKDGRTDWVAERNPPAENRDIYFFGYGHDYKAALGDYVKVAGRIALPPRWTFGYWWSRYWQYSDDEVRQLVEDYRSMGLGMDVMIIDMDWHDTWGMAAGAAKDEFGQSIGWTGYTWKKELFPKPSALMDWLHAKKLKVGLNIHPASGIQPYEDCYQSFTADYGWPASPKPVPFRISERKWADSWFKTVLGPKEDEGVDFWWMDWQQWLESKYVKDLSVTFWLNHTMAEHMAERKGASERPFIYHRWGGLGSHRYQTGFSGDTVAEWEVLGYSAWFTATSGNVGYGYWGHDLGGHGVSKAEAAAGRLDGEKYLRWMQWGVFTPTFKTHCAKELISERRPWMFPAEFSALRETFRLRYQLAPYIYTAAREAYDTGISICRPMYWDWPEEDEAYAPRRAQYMFGNDILAAPVWHPVDPATGLATYEVWLPEGEWYEVASGELLSGGRVLSRTVTKEENPWFVRAGAIIPMYPKDTMNLAQTPEEIELFVAPGEQGETEVYEDDGVGSNYPKAYARTPVAWRVTDGGKGLSLTIAPRTGAFAGMRDSAVWTVRLPLTAAPTRVAVDGVELPYARFVHDGEWTYDGGTLETVVRMGRKDRTSAHVLTVEFADPIRETASALAGKKGLFGRLTALSQEYKLSYGAMVHAWAMLPDEYLAVSQLPSALTESPFAVRERVARFDRDLATFIPTLIGKRKLSVAFATRLAGQLGLPMPHELPAETHTAQLAEGLSVRCVSPTATFAVARVDARHLRVTCTETDVATLTVPLFSGFVRCYPIVNGKRTGELVLTKGVGCDPVTWIFLSPFYGATEFEIETCVDYVAPDAI